MVSLRGRAGFPHGALPVPFPAGDLGQIVAEFGDVLLVVDQPVVNRLFEVSGADAHEVPYRWWARGDQIHAAWEKARSSNWFGVR